MQCDSAAALAWLADARGRPRARAGALPPAARPLGAQRGPPLRRLGPALGGGLARPQRAPRPTRARAPRRCRRSPRRPGIPTRSRRWPTRSARWPWPRATRRRGRSSSAAPSSCTRASTSRSSARRSCCAPASRSPPPASARPRSSTSPRPTASRARLGAAPLAAERAAEVVALGASLEPTTSAAARPPSTSTAGLSRRELEVMRLGPQGLTNREIAERLVLSTRTVDMHMRNILAKLRCRTRTEAAARAAELGLLEVASAALTRARYATVRYRARVRHRDRRGSRPVRESGGARPGRDGLPRAIPYRTHRSP